MRHVTRVTLLLTLVGEGGGGGGTHVSHGLSSRWTFSRLLQHKKKRNYDNGVLGVVVSRYAIFFVAFGRLRGGAAFFLPFGGYTKGAAALTAEAIGR